MDKIIEMVLKFADMVKAFATTQVENNRAYRLERAFQTIEDVLNETDSADITIGTVEVPAADIRAAKAHYESLQAEVAEARQEVAKLATRVNVYVEDEVLDADTQEIADQALALYAEVTKSPKARNLRAAS